MRLAEQSGILNMLAPHRKSRGSQPGDCSSSDTPPVDAQEKQQLQLERLREEQKQRILSVQKAQEENARASGFFCLHQRTRYLHKSSGEWLDAQVMAVHRDDGPDNPYYTIQYYNQASQNMRIEKQTTGDRLEALEWDENRVWEILSSKMTQQI
jgi:hypothetical protein